MWPVLLGVRDHDRGVDVEHDDLAEVGPGDLRDRETSLVRAQKTPDVAPCAGPSSSDPLDLANTDLVQGPPHRGL